MNWKKCKERAKEELPKLPPGLNEPKGWFLAGFYAALDEYQESTPAYLQGDAVRVSGVKQFETVSKCEAAKTWKPENYFNAGWGYFVFWVRSFADCFNDKEKD